MLEEYIKRLFFREDFELFFHIGVKKLVNQVINEIFRQMTITLTLALDVPVRPIDAPVRPMDAKGLRVREGPMCKQSFRDFPPSGLLEALKTTCSGVVTLSFTTGWCSKKHPILFSRSAISIDPLSI